MREVNVPQRSYVFKDSEPLHVRVGGSWVQIPAKEVVAGASIYTEDYDLTAFNWDRGRIEEHLRTTQPDFGRAYNALYEQNGQNAMPRFRRELSEGLLQQNSLLPSAAVRQSLNSCESFDRPTLDILVDELQRTGPLSRSTYERWLQGDIRLPTHSSMQTISGILDPSAFNSMTQGVYRAAHIYHAAWESALSIWLETETGLRQQPRASAGTYAHRVQTGMTGFSLDDAIREISSSMIQRYGTGYAVPVTGTTIVQQNGVKTSKSKQPQGQITSQIDAFNMIDIVYCAWSIFTRLGFDMLNRYALMRSHSESLLQGLPNEIRAVDDALRSTLTEEERAVLLKAKAAAENLQIDLGSIPEEPAHLREMRQMFGSMAIRNDDNYLRGILVYSMLGERGLYSYDQKYRFDQSLAVTYEEYRSFVESSTYLIRSGVLDAMFNNLMGFVEPNTQRMLTFASEAAHVLPQQLLREYLMDNRLSGQAGTELNVLKQRSSTPSYLSSTDLKANYDRFAHERTSNWGSYTRWLSSNGEAPWNQRAVDRYLGLIGAPELIGIFLIMPEEYRGHVLPGNFHLSQEVLLERHHKRGFTPPVPLTFTSTI